MTTSLIYRIRQYRIYIALFITALVLFLLPLAPQFSLEPLDQSPLPAPPIVQHHLQQREQQQQQQQQQQKHHEHGHELQKKQMETSTEKSLPKLPKLPSLDGSENGVFKNRFVIRPYMHKVARALPGTQIPDTNDFNTLDILSSGSGNTRIDSGFPAKMLPSVSRLPRTEKFPASNQYRLPTESYKSLPGVQASSFYSQSSSQQSERQQRLNTIRNAFLASWKTYKAHAWGADEIRPISQAGINPFTGWGASMIDALDTMQIMGLTSEFRDAVNYIDSVDFGATFRNSIPMFEIVIRYLGGLISAYDLSGQKEPVLLAKAIQLGDNLIGAFDTPNRMPRLHFKWQDADWKFRELSGSSSNIAELASMNMEFTRLAQLTGNNSYFDAVHRITVALSEVAPNLPKPYLFPGNVDSSGCSVVPINNEPLPSEELGNESQVSSAESSAPAGSSNVTSSSSSSPSTSTSSTSTDSNTSPSPSSSSTSTSQATPSPSTTGNDKRSTSSTTSTPQPTSNNTSPSPTSTSTPSPGTSSSSSTRTPTPRPNSAITVPGPNSSLNVSGASSSNQDTMSAVASSAKPASSAPAAGSSYVVYDTIYSSNIFYAVTSYPGASAVTHTSATTYTSVKPRTTQYFNKMKREEHSHSKNDEVKPSVEDVSEVKREEFDHFQDSPVSEGEESSKMLSKRQNSGGVRNVISVYNSGQSLITGCQQRGIYADTGVGSGIGIGGGTDSAYEYYVKEYALLNGGMPIYQNLYEKTIDAATENFMYRPMVQGNPDILFMGGRINRGNNFWQYDNSMSHLTCFVGGMYALGSKMFNRPQDLDYARKLTNGCVWAYNATDTGVMPEWFSVRRCPSAPSSGGSAPSCNFDASTADQTSREENNNLLEKLRAQGISTGNYDASVLVTDSGSSNGAYNKPASFLQMAPSYALRPEALESVFYMYRVTGEREWQEKGWNMVSSILQLSAVPDASGNVIGYSGVTDVTDNRRQGPNNSTSRSLFLDYCESFWYAETLKYAYLIFDDNDHISLDRYVFNTEGHPFQIPT